MSKNVGEKYGKPWLTEQNRSTKGCSKHKSQGTRQVQERFVSTLEHVQVPKWDRTSVRRNKRPLLAYRTRCKGRWDVAIQERIVCNMEIEIVRDPDKWWIQSSKLGITPTKHEIDDTRTWSKVHNRKVTYKYQLYMKHVGEKCKKLWLTDVDLDGRTDTYYHTIIRPVRRRAHKNGRYQHREMYLFRKNNLFADI